MRGNAWTITDGNGMTHQLEIQIKAFGGLRITVDGNVYKVKSSNWLINIVDYSVDFPGVNCHVVLVGNKSRLAVNGTYNDDGSAYEPLSSIPTWAWVLVGLSVVGGLLVGGWLFAIIGAAFGATYISAILKKNNSKAIVLFIVFAVLCVAWLGVQIWLAANGMI